MIVLCINDLDRPNQIPISKWIKKDREYTVLRTIKCNTDGGKTAFVLEEIDLVGCEPYEGFDSRRFALLINLVEIEEKQLEVA